jgi:hypothetical protein
MRGNWSIRDVRLELKPIRAVLAWPLHVGIRRLFLDPPNDDSIVWPSLFLEPQIRLGETDYRCLVGSRWVFNWGVLGFVTEAGGLVGTDGHGGFVGAGIQPFMRPSEPGYYVTMGLLALVYRHVWTQHEHRNEISLDLLYVQF